MTCFLTQNEKRLRRERKLRRCASLTLCLGMVGWVLFLICPRASNGDPLAAFPRRRLSHATTSSNKGSRLAF